MSRASQISVSIIVDLVWKRAIRAISYSDQKAFLTDTEKDKTSSRNNFIRKRTKRQILVLSDLLIRPMPRYSSPLEKNITTSNEKANQV